MSESKATEAVYMPGPHIHIAGIKPVVDGVIADAMRSVVDRPLRAVRGISQKGAAYANITFDEEVTYDDVANIAQQLRRADAAVYTKAELVEEGKERPSFTLYMRKRNPKDNLYVTKISAEKPTEAELYEAFGKYGVVVSVHIPLARHTAYVQFKDEPTLNIEELRETLASPELHIAQYATGKVRASRTLFVTFTIETTDDEIKSFFAKQTTVEPKILPQRKGFEVRAATIAMPTAEEMNDLLSEIKSEVVEAVPFRPRAQRIAENAKKRETKREELKVNYRDCNVYVSSISTAGVDMAALREKLVQAIGDREVVRQGIFDPKEGAETTVAFVQFTKHTDASNFTATINGKTNAEVFEGLFVEKVTEGEEKVEKVTEQGKRVLKAAIVRPKEEHAAAKQAAAPEATINDEERTRRGNFAYPLISTFINEHPEAVALVDAIVAKHQTADITEDERVTNIEDAVALCTGIIIDKQFNNFDVEFTENIAEYVMKALNEIKGE